VAAPHPAQAWPPASRDTETSDVSEVTRAPHSTTADRLLGRLKFCLPLDLAHLSGVRERLAAFLAELGVDAEHAEELVLCAQEALKNAIRFSDSSRGVDVDVRVTPVTVSLVVRDYGCGLDGAADRLGELISHPPHPLVLSGRGFYVMATLMDELDLRSQDGLQVRMVKRIG